MRGTQEVPKAGTAAEKGLAIADKISYNIILSELYNFDISMDGFPSGQRGQTVNLLQIASVVRIHLRPSAGVAELADARDLKSRG